MTTMYLCRDKAGHQQYRQFWRKPELQHGEWIEGYTARGAGRSTESSPPLEAVLVALGRDLKPGECVPKEVSDAKVSQRPVTVRPLVRKRKAA